MEIFALIAGILTACLLGPAGLIKLSRLKATDLLRQRYSISPGAFKIFGLIEFTCAISILVGINEGLEWIGFFGAIGAIVLAIYSGLRHKAAADRIKEFIPALAISAFAIVYIAGLPL